jgi:hypothetical protein
MKTNYQVTIGYKSVVCVNLLSETEDEAKGTAMDLFEKEHQKWYGKHGIELQDDSYCIGGVLNMDETWNLL